jgi:hypothetical protein
VAGDQLASEVCIMRRGVMIVTLPDDTRTTDSRNGFRGQIARVSILEIPAVECLVECLVGCLISDGIFSVGASSALQNCIPYPVDWRGFILGDGVGTAAEDGHIRRIRLQRNGLHLHDKDVPIDDSQVIDSM